MKSFSLDAPHFNLVHTLECGQVFRWDRISSGEYLGVAGSAIVIIRQQGSRLYVQSSDSSTTPLFIKSYLDLALDLPFVYNRIGKDKFIRAAIKEFDGLRIIGQPLWECLASFIISSYNNIPRIKGIIGNISRCFGKRLILGNRLDYSFPAPQALADSGCGRLRQCGAGFRAGFLKNTARAFLDRALCAATLKEMPYAAAKRELMQLDGVGDKVADCVLLYAAGKFEAFPVDTWIKRIMQKLYFGRKETSEKKIREFAGEYFGEYAGYAQQYLYHYGRTGGIR